MTAHACRIENSACFDAGSEIAVLVHDPYPDEATTIKAAVFERDHSNQLILLWNNLDEDPVGVSFEATVGQVAASEKQHGGAGDVAPVEREALDDRWDSVPD